MDYKKIANEGHEEVSRFTSSDFCGRPVPHRLRREKRLRNRAAKREEDRKIMAEQCNPDSF